MPCRLIRTRCRAFCPWLCGSILSPHRARRGYWVSPWYHAPTTPPGLTTARGRRCLTRCTAARGGLDAAKPRPPAPQTPEGRKIFPARCRHANLQTNRIGSPAVTRSARSVMCCGQGRRRGHTAGPRPWAGLTPTVAVHGRSSAGPKRRSQNRVPRAHSSIATIPLRGGAAMAGAGRSGG